MKNIFRTTARSRPPQPGSIDFCLSFVACVFSAFVIGSLNVETAFALSVQNENVDEQSPTMAMKTSRDALNIEVENLNQNLTCRADTDCISIPLGAKPCGGPRRYLVTSKRNPKFAQLKNKLNEANRLDQKINETDQLMSDCIVTPELRAHCTAHRCAAIENRNEPKPR